MTRKGRLVLLATIVLYLAGAANDSQPAYSFASALLGVLLVAYVLSRLAASGMRLLSTSVPETVMADADNPLAIELSNAALIAKPRSRVTYRLIPVSLPGPEKREGFRVPPLQRGLRVLVELPFSVPWRGHWRLEGLRLEGSDPLGLFERPEQSVTPVDFVATPAYWAELPVPAFSLLAPGTRMLMSAERVDRGEYRSIREYTPGDDIRHVHWRATAHRGKLSIKEYDRLREVQAQVWLAPVAATPGVVWEAEVAVSTAATLAHCFALAPLPTVLRTVGLLPDAAGPGQGELFWRQLVSALAGVPYLPAPDLGRHAAAWARQVSVGATVYLVSNSAEALASMVQVLGPYAHPVTVLTGKDRTEGFEPRLLVPDYEGIPAALTWLASSNLGEVGRRGL